MNFKKIAPMIQAAVLALASTALAGQGGISGGGGGLAHSHPVDIDHVTRAMSESKLMLLAYLNGYEGFYRTTGGAGRDGDADDRVWKKVFSPAPGAPSVFDVIDSLLIETRRGAPCVDPTTGKAVDGSADRSKPGKICISAFTLQKKLNDYDYEFEIPALIFHEVTHLFGATEKEAVAAQWQLLYGLMTQRHLAYQIRLKVRIGDLAQRFVVDQMLLGASVGMHGPRYVCGEMKMVERSFDDLVQGLPTEGVTGLSPVRYSQQETGYQLMIKAQALTNYICSQDEALEPLRRSYYANRYAQGFGAGDEVLSDAYLAQLNGSDAKLEKSPYPVMIRKIPTGAGISDELLDLKKYVVEIGRQTETISKKLFELN